jgi:hypothetical protein
MPIDEKSIPKIDDDELKFQNWIRSTEWYNQFTKQYGEEPNLDDPMYDYRKAWKSGVEPQINLYDGTYHWPSKTPSGEWLKSKKHPTAWMELFMEKYGYDPQSEGITKDQTEWK